MNDEIKKALRDYRKAREELEWVRNEHFPVGSLAKNKNSTDIVGKVATPRSGPAYVSLFFENGNTWDFPLEQVVPVPCPDESKSDQGCVFCRRVGGCPKR